MPGVAAEGRELAYRCISELIRVLILQVRSKDCQRRAGESVGVVAVSLLRFCYYCYYNKDTHRFVRASSPLMCVCVCTRF